MAKKTVAGIAGKDPTLPDVPLEIGGKTYRLVYDYNAIVLAERELNAAARAKTPRGMPFVPVNLLRGFDLEAANAEELRGLLYASLLKAQPKITLDDVSQMISFSNLEKIYTAIVHCWIQSHTEVDPGGKERPTGEPGES